MVHCDSISAEISESKKLWKNIEPHLKKALHTLYLREVSSSQWERYQQELENSEDVALHGRNVGCTFLHALHPVNFRRYFEMIYKLFFLVFYKFCTCHSTVYIQLNTFL